MPDAPEAVKPPVEGVKKAGGALASGVKKIPTWGWVVIIGGGLLIGLYAARKRAQDAAYTAQDQGDGTDVVADSSGDVVASDRGAYNADLETPPIAYDGNVFGVGAGSAPLPSAVPPPGGAVTLTAPVVVTGGGAPNRPPAGHRGPAPAHAKPKKPPGLDAGMVRGSDHAKLGFHRVGGNAYTHPLSGFIWKRVHGGFKRTKKRK